MGHREDPSCSACHNLMNPIVWDCGISTRSDDGATKKPTAGRLMRSAHCLGARSSMVQRCCARRCSVERMTSQRISWLKCSAMRWDAAWKALKQMTKPYWAATPNETDLRIELTSGGTM